MEWIGKRYDSKKDCDVVISKAMNENADGKHRSAQYEIRFNNGQFRKISRNQRMVYAFRDSRLYFTEGDGKSGFKVSTCTNDGMSAKTRVSVMNEKFLGSHKIWFDKKEKLFYIWAEERNSWIDNTVQDAGEYEY